MPDFRIADDDFELDGRPHRILSGALHYFRVHPEQWADRIRKARLMGLNTIETYVAWNAHEPRRGEWDQTGGNDLGAFLDTVAAEGLHAIVRPGPYICAEWHNGGLPVWLTGMDGIGLRSSEPRYLAEVTTYLRRIYDIVGPRQIDRGGTVVLVQIENEYGAYGDDKEYLAELVRVTREAGITVPLTTVDQPVPQMLRDGSLPGVHLTGSFGSRAGERLATLRAHQPTGPLMCSEFWDGWFDWWGGHHHTTSEQETASELETLLAAGASVNFYMFHGGTNFGLTNGANDKGRYLPLVTSYDYSAPLDEAGNPTEKYHAFREVIARYAPVPDETPAPAIPAPAFEVPMRPSGSSARFRTTASQNLPTFEDLGFLGALVSYETEIPDAAFRGAAAVLRIDEVRDLAWVRVDGVPVGRMSRTAREFSLVVPRGTRLQILVEDQGRVNYDRRLGEPKGLIGPAFVGGVELTGWRARPIDLHALVEGAAGADSVGDPDAVPDDVADDVAIHPGTPAVFTGVFAADGAHDLFLHTAGWGKGFACVNGFLLGRYWRNGPQRTLYVPAPVLREGENSLALVELEHTTATAVRFVAQPDLGVLAE